MSRHQARRPVSRRLLLEGIAGCGLTAALGRPWIAAAKAQTCCPDDVPRLDGEYLDDDAARRSAAADFGRSVHRLPLAVVKPRTVDDVVRVVAHANHNGIKVAMRGQAHSLYGQALADGGIVINSASLRDVGEASDDTIDAQAGATVGRRGESSAGARPPAAGHARCDDAVGRRHAQRRRHGRDRLPLRHPGRSCARARRRHRDRRARHLLGRPGARALRHDARRARPMRDHRAGAARAWSRPKSSS